MTKINKKSPHAADQKMVLATHRTAPTTNPNCSRIYLRNLQNITRTTPVTATELAVRNKFTAVSRSVAQRINDVSHHASDLAAFNAQKNQPGGKKTLRAYLWQVLGDVYDENQG